MKKILLITLLFVSQFVLAQDKIAVFDMDGTLISESPNYALADFAKKYSTSQIETMDDLVNGLTELSNNPKYPKYLKSFFKKHDIRVYPYMMNVVDSLKKEGYTLVLCTGSEVRFAEEVNKRYLNNSFDVVIGSEFRTEKLKAKNININDKEGKVDNLKARGIKPTVAYGNSHGDFPMMKYVGNAYLVIHDDEANKEYDKPEQYTKECKELGFKTIKISDWNLETLDAWKK
ncbi:haloacid dehalogenase-like hydrolase [Flammeovirga sp. MY04]|uniref:HAD family hydrolase n=1 Tax=Flammeovirga sp. MY04 TaxID=1191459 RepID=UPI00080609AC|nr:HAD-IB family phosphatase [Flammeovirga sp. MY04]ANQ48101.1 haloacid dehalogenase-like hydrolase [Flammeovirga sp. MY04]